MKIKVNTIVIPYCVLIFISSDVKSETKSLSEQNKKAMTEKQNKNRTKQNRTRQNRKPKQARTEPNRVKQK